MDSFFEIIKKRSAPGILIFDMDNNLQFCNKEALDMIPALQKQAKSRKSKQQSVPEAILKLCNLMKSSLKENKTIEEDKLNCAILDNETGPPCSLRAFCIGHHPKDGIPTHIMVLSERVIEKHKADYVKIKSNFKLTKRELDVLKLISGGMTNKEIAKELSIGEYTVKDHIKSIMRKMEVGSRSEIISRTLQQ